MLHSIPMTIDFDIEMDAWNDAALIVDEYASYKIVIAIAAKPYLILWLLARSASIAFLLRNDALE